MKYLSYFFESYNGKNASHHLSKVFEAQMALKVKKMLIEGLHLDADLFEKKVILMQYSYFHLHVIESNDNARYFQMELVVDRKVFSINIFFRHRNGMPIDVTDNNINGDDIVFWYDWLEPHTKEVNFNAILHTVHHLRINRKLLSYELSTKSFLPNDFELVIRAPNDYSQTLDIVAFLNDSFSRHNSEKGHRWGTLARFELTFFSEKHGAIYYSIDLGTAPLSVLTKALEGLSSFQTITLIHIHTKNF